MAIKHTFMGKDGPITKELSPLQAVRQKCLECSNFSATEVRECTIKDCALYPFRSGKSGIKRNLTDEQKNELRERLKNVREQKKPQ